jgi:hypothetical protein
MRVSEELKGVKVDDWIQEVQGQEIDDDETDAIVMQIEQKADTISKLEPEADLKPVEEGKSNAATMQAQLRVEAKKILQEAKPTATVFFRFSHREENKKILSVTKQQEASGSSS